MYQVISFGDEIETFDQTEVKNIGHKFLSLCDRSVGATCKAHTSKYVALSPVI